MAGDWIKMEKDTPEKPEILALASILSRSVADVFLACFKVWRWADSQISDGYARRVTSAQLDEISGLPGFTSALHEVGWLRIRDGALQFPNFERHMGKSAKNRALTASRMKKSRDGKSDAESVTKPSPEKRREDKKEELPPALPASKPCRERARDPVWDALCAVFSLSPATKTECSRVGKIVRDLKAKGATPEEIAIRVQRYRAKWPDISCTPEALFKHWDAFAGAAPADDKRQRELEATRRLLDEQDRQHEAGNEAAL